MSDDQHESRASDTAGARDGSGQGLVGQFIAHMEPWVFLPAAALVIAFVVLGSVFTDAMAGFFEAAQQGIIRNFGWAYILVATGLMGFTLWLMLGPFGHVRLGGDEDRPEFGRAAWFSMLFSAGMGTGLVFWSVAEPLSHRLQPPPTATDADPNLLALRYTFFHWGLHPWAIYGVFGLGLAYLHFRRGLPLAPRSLLQPLIGKHIEGPIGHAIDTVATVGTLFGVATSLGLGAMQLNTGLDALFGVPQGRLPQVIIIAAVTLLATISVVSGLRHGVRRLSQLNLSLATLLLVFVGVTGPTLYLIELGVSALGSYLQHLPEMSLRVTPGGQGGWQSEWTLFYWAWWISWCPFVGVFTARVSRGRTVREYLLGVLLAPSLATFLWLSVFGGTGLHVQASDASFADPVIAEPALALHALLGKLPLAHITTAVSTLLVLIFFVTSSDSGSLVDDMVTSGGDPNPPRAQRVFWAVSEGAVASTLLMTGGLQALRTASLTTGLPMMLLLVAGSVALYRALREERRT